MELTDIPQPLSGLIGSRVEDASGHFLGRLYDLQGRLGDDGSVEVEQLVAGRGGLWRRLKGAGSRGTTVAWGDVLEVTAGRIVVAGDRGAGAPDR